MHVIEPNNTVSSNYYTTFTPINQNAPSVATDDPDDDPEKPVPVRSVLNKLKPSDRRYSLRRDDEL